MGCASSSASAAICQGEEEDKLCTSAHRIYNFREKIGRGSFAQVHIATKKQTNTLVAVKIYHLHPESQALQDETMKASINELNVWNAVGNHANCVRLIDSFFDGHLAYMVMEKCDCSLFKYLQGRTSVTESCLGKAFGQILNGISHLHFVSVLHRDIKPENLLVRRGTVKICDFGLAAMIPQSGFVAGIAGSPPYMAPEMLETQTSDEKADVWSVGCVAYLFLCGKFPYETSDGSAKMMKRAILNGETPNCNRTWLSFKAVSFLLRLLRRKPSQRPDAKLASQMSFISNPDDSSNNLRCLKEVLNLAAKIGGIDSNEVKSTTTTDVTLNKLNNGELVHRFIKSFTSDNCKDAYLKPRSKDAKVKLPKTMEESPRSESTACDTSSSTMSSRKSSKSSYGRGQQ